MAKLNPVDLYNAYMDLRRMTVADMWGIAVFANRNGLKTEAEATLWTILDKDPTQKPDVDAYLSKVKGVPVPPGGFIAISQGAKPGHGGLLPAVKFART